MLGAVQIASSSYLRRMQLLVRVSRSDASDDYQRSAGGSSNWLGLLAGCVSYAGRKGRSAMGRGKERGGAMGAKIARGPRQQGRKEIASVSSIAKLFQSGAVDANSPSTPSCQNASLNHRFQRHECWLLVVCCFDKRCALLALRMHGQCQVNLLAFAAFAEPQVTDPWLPFAHGAALSGSLIVVIAFCRKVPKRQVTTLSKGTRKMSTATRTKSAPAKNKPVHEIRNGSLKATIWLNSANSGKEFYTTTFTRSYRTSEGEWRDSSQMNSSDLLLLSKMAELAHQWIATQS